MIDFKNISQNNWANTRISILGAGKSGIAAGVLGAHVGAKVFISESDNSQEIVKNIEGDTFYVELDTVKAINGYIYWWGLSNYIEPNPLGSMSGIIFFQGECELKRFKYLSDTYYKKLMGQGAVTSSSNIPDEEWELCTT